MDYYTTEKLKEVNFTICNNMDKTRGYYAEWNKVDRERQILHGFTKQNKTTLIEIETNKTAYQREGMGEKGEGEHNNKVTNNYQN